MLGNLWLEYSTRTVQAQERGMGSGEWGRGGGGYASFHPGAVRCEGGKVGR